MSDLKVSGVYEDEDLTIKARKINECVTVWNDGKIWVEEFADVTFEELAAIVELLKKEGRV